MLLDAKARRVSPGERALAAGGVAGLFLDPSARRGEGKWILRFVSPITGKRRDLGLGAYPATGIALARRLGSEARMLIAEGQDPIEARRMAKAEMRNVAKDTRFLVAAESAYEELKPGFRNTKHAAQWITTLKTYVFPGSGMAAQFGPKRYSCR